MSRWPMFAAVAVLLRGRGRWVLFAAVLVVATPVISAAVGAAGDLAPGGTFIDDDGNVHEGAIEAIAAVGITKGCNPPSNDLFCPSGTVTRGQMAAFLARALGLTDNGGGDLFVDDDGSIFENDIDKLGTAAVTKGCNPPVNDRYCPDGKVTRGQMAAFLVRAFGYTDDGGGDLFVDDDGSVFEPDIDRLGTAGVTRGCNPPGNDRFCPNNPVLRGQMASFLTRALGLTPMVPPPIEALVVNGQPLALDSGVFPLAGMVNPGDQLLIEATIRDLEPGTVEVLGTRVAYTPSGNRAKVTLTVEVPADLTAAEIPILVEDREAGVIGFVPGSEWAPVVVVGLRSGFAGQRLEIPIDIVDLNADPVEIAIEQVLGLGDRYEGNEYVTSRPLAEFTLRDGALNVRSDTPGNFRISLTASDGALETVTEFDVPISWAPGENPWEIRGIGIDTWGPPEIHDFGAIPSLVRAAGDVGMNFVQFAPYWHAADVTGSVIVSCAVVEDQPCTTPSDAELRSWIKEAHDAGMSVLLKPHLIVGTYDRSNGSYDAEGWQINPSDPASWFESYESFIVHYARIAEEEGVQMFAVGNELTGTQVMTSRWRQVIGAVREVYQGPLTYSDVLLWQVWEGAAGFWDDLDFIGVPYYFPGSEGNNQPTVAQMMTHIQGIQQTNFETVASQFPDIPILATEMGRPNFDGTNHDPWDWTERTVDNQELVDYVEAALLTQLNYVPRLKGVFIWAFKIRENTFFMDWDFRGKPLEEALKFWFSN